MADKKDVQVVINDKVLTLTGEESAEYMQKLALYINNKLNECRMSGQFPKLSLDYQYLLLSINIADDYHKTKEQLEKMQAQVEQLEKQVYDVQHDQIETKIKYESSKKLIDDYKMQIAEMQKKILQKQKEINQDSLSNTRR